MNEFWDEIDRQLDECEHATCFDDVRAALGGTNTFYGSGGDRQLYEALKVAGWTFMQLDNGWEHHWRMRAPNGDVMQYIEGDIVLEARIVNRGQ